MSLKRTSAESDSDAQDNECSDSVFQQQGNAKRARLVSPIDTTLQDLPTELLEDILIKAVLMEVNEMKLAKSVWKEKADHVMARLASVCSRWTGILTTNFFERKVRGILESTDSEIRLELLQHSSLNIFALDVTTIRDKVLVLWSEDFHDYSINVYDRNDMPVVKEVIPLPHRTPLGMAACSALNCVYLLNAKERHQVSILRISRDLEQQFDISVMIGDLFLPDPTLSVTAAGDLILSRQDEENGPVISIYSANGFWQHEVSLSSEFYGFSEIIPKSNGNLILVSFEEGQYQTKLTEINLDGTVLRQCLSLVRGCGSVCQADIHERLLLAERGSTKLILLDSEFNLMEFTGPKLDEYHLNFSYDLGLLHYNYERNEIVRYFDSDVLSFFRITDDLIQV